MDTEFEPVKPGKPRPEPSFQLENAKTLRRYHFRFRTLRFRTLSLPQAAKLRLLVLTSVRILQTLKDTCRIDN
jgi:hypothetical protein